MRLSKIRYAKIRSIGRLLMLFGVVSVALNFFFLFFFPYGSGRSDNGPANSAFVKKVPLIQMLLRALVPDAMDGDRDTTGEDNISDKSSTAAAIGRWSDAVSTFLESTGDVGWGRRTGGVILAGEAETICGVPFDGNVMRRNQQHSIPKFKANVDMVAGGNAECKSQLERVVSAGWHQGQMFFYRLLVDRPGHYTVRMAVVLYHEDDKRGDGLHLGLEDLLEVHLQCAKSKGRYVVEPSKVFDESGTSIAVVEYQTVALGGEILLVLEGIYTCVGLSLVEIFSHENPDDNDLLDTSAGGAGDRDALENSQKTGKSSVPLLEVPVPKLGRSYSEAGSVALREVWQASGATCATAFKEEARTQYSLQLKSVSLEAAAEQRYFNEWARRERLEQSTARYCRPRQAPRLGEPGWTWAGRSTRLERTAAEEQRKAEASRKVQEAASETYRIAIEAALEAGARLGAAQILAAEALDRAMDETLGAGVSEEAQLAARERVVKAVRLMAEGADGEAAAARSRKQVDGVVDPESLHDRSLDSEVIFDKGRRRERRNLVATGAAKDEVTIAFYPGGRGPRLIPSPHTNPDAPIADVSVVSVLSPSGSGQSIPPPMCPLRLVDLMEEALHVAADTPSSEEKMWDPTVAALSDGAAAAAERARSRTQGSMGRMLTAAAEGWGTPSLPNWLGLSARARTGPGPGLGIERDGRHERALARRDLAKRALGSGFEAVAAVRAHDVQWPGRGGDNASGNMGQGGEQGQRQRQSKIGPGSGTLPVQFTGFTWDGVTVVMKEVVPGCARVAQPVTPNFVDVQKMKDLQSWESTWVGYYGDRGSVPEEEEQNGSGVDDVDVDSGGKRPCLVVEAMVVPSKDIVVDIIVPVSSGLVPRLSTLMPQMERLALGAACTPLPDSNILAPKCNDPEYYSPAFWPEKLTRKGRRASSSFSSPAGNGGSWSQGDHGANNRSRVATEASPRLRGRGKGGGIGNGDDFRVIVVTDDPAVEALLTKYNVDAVYVATRAPFSKARAIQDASQVIPDDHILFVHDADLFPPCGLPDALRQTVVRGVQAVNLLLPYENQGARGKCLYPISTFGPMAMYKSDFVAVGGIEDTNSGRWGFEDTAFLHKVMLGNAALGVLRVHLPGLVHRWHEITPWKCLVWVWDSPVSDDHGGAGAGLLVVQKEDPPDSPAFALGA